MSVKLKPCNVISVISEEIEIFCDLKFFHQRTKNTLLVTNV